VGTPESALTPAPVSTSQLLWAVNNEITACTLASFGNN
jgi:hypothetical protein